MAVRELDVTAPNYETALITLGVTGSLNYAPHGTEMPDKMDAYETPWVDLGWLGDNGIGEAMNEEREDWTPYQASSPQRGQVTSQEFTFTATVWSLGGLATALYYGVPEEDMEFDTESGVVQFEQGAELPPDFRFNMGVDVIDGQKARRFLLPAASVIERGDVTYTKTELVGYELTFRANLDARAGYAVRRLFMEGWRPGTAGTTLDGGGVQDLGDWSAPATEVEGGGGGAEGN